MDSAVATCRVSFSAARGILVSQPGVEQASPTWQGRFLASGPPGKSLDTFKETLWQDKIVTHLTVSMSRLMVGKKEFCQQTASGLKLHTSCWFYFLENLDWYRFSSRDVDVKIVAKRLRCPENILFLAVEVVCASAKVTDKICARSNWSIFQLFLEKYYFREIWAMCPLSKALGWSE